MSEKTTREFSDIRDAERARIDSQRLARGNEKEALSALCISGGGIRSASVGLGVLQALLKGGELRNIDYLSTVSGGGYIGSALSWLLSSDPDASVNPRGQGQYFPLGTRGRGARTHDERDALNYIRQHGKYLNPGKGINLVSLFGVVTRSMLISILIYFSILTFGMFIMHSVETAGIILFEAAYGMVEVWIPDGLVYVLGGILVAALLVVFYIFYALSTWFTSAMGFQTYRLRLFAERQVGRLWLLLLVLFTIGSLPYAAEGINWLWLVLEPGPVPEGADPTSEIEGIRHFAVAAASTILGLIGGFLKQRMAPGPGSESSGSGIIGTVFTWLILIMIVYGLLLLSHATSWTVFCEQISNACDRMSGHAMTWENWWAASLWFLVPGLLFGLFVDLNHLSLHRMYRDRLMEEFMPGKRAIAENRWHPSRSADGARVADFCAEDVAGPYHIVNTNLILVDSPEAKYRGRGGDSFVFSPLWSGSDATGWIPTEDYMGGGMSLATAMAISGAAANPDAGPDGSGLTRNRLVSILMFLMNMRLGYWAVNPSARNAGRGTRIPPSYIYPGLVQGLFGINLDARHKYVQLSDGGHFDNLGLYEMVRRRVPLIIVSDAGADPEYDFGSLGTALERIRVDFGTNIRFDNSDYDLMSIVSGSGTPGIETERYGLSAEGFAVGAIQYADGSSGTLIYIHSALTEGLPQDIYGYKSAHPAYPHESTADQFFGEAQFEAYRELGYRLALRMLEANDREGWF